MRKSDIQPFILPIILIISFIIWGYYYAIIPIVVGTGLGIFTCYCEKENDT